MFLVYVVAPCYCIIVSSLNETDKKMETEIELVKVFSGYHNFLLQFITNDAASAESIADATTVITTAGVAIHVLSLFVKHFDMDRWYGFRVCTVRY